MAQSSQILPSSFFAQNTATVARQLLGKQLVSKLGGEMVSGLIVETEAYLPEGDSACHASQRRTPRTEVMFGRPGLAYVYPIHAKVCFNVVTEAEEQGCAVLIRALQPTAGEEVIRQRRAVSDSRRLTTGPACLCQALAIDRAVNGTDLTQRSSLWIEQVDHLNQEFKIGSSPRIGVTSAHELPLRFYLCGNPFVSGPKRLRT
jgi:DNA-3-methyladenine glycosylase